MVTSPAERRVRRNRPFGQSSGLSFGSSFQGRRFSGPPGRARAAVLAVSPASVSLAAARQPVRNRTPKLPHRQLGRASMGPAFCRKRRRRTAAPLRAGRPCQTGASSPPARNDIYDRIIEAGILKRSRSCQISPSPTTCFSSAPAWKRRAERLSARPLSGMDDGEHLRYGQSRKASRLIIAAEPASSMRSGCARWRARRPATRMPPNSRRPRSGVPRRRCAPSRAAMKARSPRPLPAPTARSISISTRSVWPI